LEKELGRLVYLVPEMSPGLKELKASLGWLETVGFR
jgi:hypothetical protein